MARPTRIVDVEVRGLNAVLRALRQFPPEATAELRDESGRIASEIMLPAWQAAARSAPHVGDRIAGSMRVRRDRVPSLSVGYARRVFSGGASTIMVRYPSHAGQVRDSIPDWFTPTGWIDRASASYKPQAMDAWGDAIERVVRKWNVGAS